MLNVVNHVCLHANSLVPRAWTTVLCLSRLVCLSCCCCCSCCWCCLHPARQAADLSSPGPDRMLASKALSLAHLLVQLLDSQQALHNGHMPKRLAAILHGDEDNSGLRAALEVSQAGASEQAGWHLDTHAKSGCTCTSCRQRAGQQRHCC